MNNLLRRAITVSFLLALAAPASAQDVVALEPESAVGNYLAGMEAFHDLRTGDAARYFRAAASADWDNPLVLERAFIAYAANGQVDDAADTAKHMLSLNAPTDMARIVIATQAIKQRRYGAAITALEQMGSDSFDGVTGVILRAWALTGEGKPDSAFSELDRLADGGLEDFLVFHRALMADISGRSEEAIKLIQRALSGDGRTERVVEAYARILGNAGRFDDAIGAIVDFESQGLNHPLTDAVKIALANKQRPGPFAKNVDAGAAEMFNAIGLALAQEGSVDIGIVYLRLAVYLNPDADIMLLALAQLYDSAGRSETANGIYDLIQPSSPLRSAAIVRIADNLDALGDRGEAIRRLSNIVTTNPTDIDAIATLGNLLRADKRFAEAADAFTKVLALTPGERPADWRYYYARGIAYERNKQWDEAEADFLKALDLNPDQPQVLNYLGYSWVDQGSHLDRALEMIKKAIAGAPDDGYIIDSLGWAYYRLGRFDEAVTELERAVSLRPNDPEINDHLGDAYWRAGRRLEAHFQWNIAASVDTEGEVKARVAPKQAGGLDAAPVPANAAPVADDAATQAIVP